MTALQAEQIAAALSKFGETRTTAEVLEMGPMRAGHLLGIARRNHETEIVRTHHAFATHNR